MESKFFGIISLSRKAGKLQHGFDAVKEAAQKGEARLLLYAADLSPKTRSSMTRMLEGLESPPAACDTPMTMHEYGRICGKATGVLALTDAGFATAAVRLLAADEEE